MNQFILMNSVAAGLSEQDSADLAVWFESLPSAQGKQSRAALDKAEILVAKGNGKKLFHPVLLAMAAMVTEKSRIFLPWPDSNRNILLMH